MDAVIAAKPVWKEVKSDLVIRFDPQVQIRLMTIFHAYRKEFSGFGFLRKEGKELIIYDFVLLDVGSEVYTEIPVQKTLKLMERSDAGAMKVWLHAHPLGTGIPSPQNWSRTDAQTILETPLGGVPEMVKWSVSVVLTPRGWVGRIDNYIQHITSHLPVLQPGELYDEVDELRKEYHEKLAKAPLHQSAWTWQDEGEDEIEEETVDLSMLANDVDSAIKSLKVQIANLEALYATMQSASLDDVFSGLDDAIIAIRDQTDNLETIQESL